ncbi:unnamed protein product [Ectocarpus sp. 6 AP-2014]
MFSVEVTCDLNFTQASAVDKAVKKALKMFQKHFDCKKTRLDADSNTEAVYRYQGMTHDETRIMKKLVHTKAMKIHLKSVESREHDDASDGEGNKKVSGTKEKHRGKSAAPIDSPLPSQAGDDSATSSQTGETPLSETRLDIIQEMRQLCTRAHVLLDKLEGR